MRPSILAMLAVCAVAPLGVSSADAAKARGTAGSSQRAEYCAEQLGNCLSAADETCNFNFGGNAQQLGACLDERRGSCNRSYGSGSKCQSAARTGGVVVQPGANAVKKK